MSKVQLLVVNCKAYSVGIDKYALKLATAAKSIKGVKAILCVQPTDIAQVSKKVDVFAQHVDPSLPGAHTGSILPEAVKAAGAKGTLLNHSENKIPPKQIEKTIARCKALKLKTIVCAKDSKEARRLSKYKPDFIAVEPPELIGGPVSVSSANPGLIKKSADAVKSNSVLLVGAGVKDANDCKVAKKLGSMGILVASGVVKAKDPKKALQDLASGLKGR